MAAPLIGVLGCGGAVGSVACDILGHSFRVRGGQRTRPVTPDKSPGCEWVHADVLDTASLARFCRGCDVILNCAGPSCRIGDRVASAAKEAGAAYVDAFGAGALEQSPAGGAPDGTVVIAAGVFPGLSGVLPLWLAAREFDGVDSLSGFAGGRETVSPGAAADLLLSSVEGFGIPNACWRNGSVCREAAADPGPTALPGFKGEVYVQQFLNTEMTGLAEKLGLSEARWHSVYPDGQTADAVSRGCALLAADAGDAVLERSVKELVTLGAMLMAGRPPWYTMVTEMQGRARGQLKRKRLVLSAPNSYRLSGIVAAATVEAVLRQPPPHGVCWAFEILDPEILMAKIEAERAVNYLEILDIPATEGHEVPVHFDEGVL